MRAQTSTPATTHTARALHGKNHFMIFCCIEVSIFRNCSSIYGAVHLIDKLCVNNGSLRLSYFDRLVPHETVTFIFHSGKLLCQDLFHGERGLYHVAKFAPLSTHKMQQDDARQLMALSCRTVFSVAFVVTKKKEQLYLRYSISAILFPLFYFRYSISAIHMQVHTPRSSREDWSR